MNKLNVFFTIDTELWLHYDTFEENLNSAIHGRTNDGNFGLGHQLDIFQEHNLKAYFFIEPLFSLRYGKQPLDEIVKLVNSYQQEIGLHIHTEWLSEEDTDFLKAPHASNNIKDYSLEEQSQIINKGLLLLKASGAEGVESFRAGNYGGNLDTLEALENNGILYDTTYNFPYLNSPCDMHFETKLKDIHPYNKVYEFPVTYFNDIGNHPRHLQLTACSLNEMKFVLNTAWQQQRNSCTIVLHSFEWIKRLKNGQVKNHKLDTICLKRFEELCKFLTDNQDKFCTPKYSEAVAEKQISEPKDIQSNILRTGLRVYEQMRRRKN
jgi:hypothetical protein